MLTLAFTIRTATHKHIQHDVRQCHLKFDAHAHACTRTHNLHAALYCRAHATARARAAHEETGALLWQSAPAPSWFFFFSTQIHHHRKKSSGGSIAARNIFYLFIFCLLALTRHVHPDSAVKSVSVFIILSFFFLHVFLSAVTLTIRAVHDVHNGPHAAKWLQRNPRNSFTELCCQRGEDIKGGAVTKYSLLAYWLLT